MTRPTFLVPVRLCRFPLHDLDVGHIFPRPGTVVTEGPIGVSVLDNGEWFVQDGRHRAIRARLAWQEMIEAYDHDEAFLAEHGGG